MLTDSMYQEKKEEEDLATLKTALTLEEYIGKQRERLFTATKNYWKHEDQQNNNQKKMGRKTTL